MLKPTESLDGVKRINRRITHRLGLEDFASILCLAHRKHDLEEDGPLPDLSRAKILEIVDKVLKEKPDARFWWTDHIDDGDLTNALLKWSADVVRRRFPEFH